MAGDIKVKFEPSEIRAAASQFRSYSDQMNHLQKNLKSKMDSLLQRDWRGKASQKLSEIIGDNWCAEVERYCDLMKELCTIMDDAAVTYETLARHAEEIRLVC